jgi:malate dehydrogenase (oxaloacetate-decarboxylating)(NADP+)
MVYNWPHDDVQVIVVTDGSRILGLGDLGANGMGIPVGKLSLYVAAGGVDPRRTLPVMLDCGTDNEELRNDPTYLGMSHPRLTGDEYYSLVHEFIMSAFERWPNALLQFEDFSTNNARALLDAYKGRKLIFNDDIQGTGAVTLAGLLGALRAQKMGQQLRDQKIFVVGAGSAGIGVADSIREGMQHQGLSEREARERFYVFDDKGLIGSSRNSADLSPQQLTYRREDEEGGCTLLEGMKKHKPGILLGLTGIGGLFKEEDIREMARHHVRPIIFPLSNPTSSAECTAQQAYEWTDGRAIVASGSPFDPVVLNGKTLNPSQCNNMFIFPGVGLGATGVRAKAVTNEMLFAGAQALAQAVTDEDLDKGMVFPPVSQIRDVAISVAAAVARSAMFHGIARRMPPADLESFLAKTMWKPVYRPIVQRVY